MPEIYEDKLYPTYSENKLESHPSQKKLGLLNEDQINKIYQNLLTIQQNRRKRANF